uniref:GCK domain-containing protein n=1 Tax=Rhizochromulina marina TaxID=1034831 RepID=A0A7S2STU1_9STRA|mmetsp:Transcript_7690/g.21883  ORF Transcript_7690/g.21883 Transcript_7690/m.21883 type:complete len:220 (+) Transcript_7690:34-693(+)
MVHGRGWAVARAVLGGRGWRRWQGSQQWQHWWRPIIPALAAAGPLGCLALSLDWAQGEASSQASLRITAGSGLEEMNGVDPGSEGKEGEELGGSAAAAAGSGLGGSAVDEERRERGRRRRAEDPCPFCKFMMDGPCRQEFEDWDDVVHEAKAAGRDFAEEAKEFTIVMMECMQANKDYYGPALGHLDEDEEGASGGGAGEGADSGSSGADSGESDQQKR